MVEQNANAIFHVSVENRECQEECNPLSNFTLILHGQIRSSILLPMAYVSQRWQGISILKTTHDFHLPLAILDQE